MTLPLPILQERSARADLEERLRASAGPRSKVKTLSGPFRQERTIGLLATKVVSTGKLALSRGETGRPDRLLWELDAPDSVSYWVGPEGLAYKGKQGQGRLPLGSKVAPALDDLRVILGDDLGKLRERYDLREIAASGKRFAFEATPKNTQGARFQKITLEIEEDLVRPRSVVLVEGPRDKTEITFGEMNVDVPIDPARVRPPF